MVADATQAREGPGVRTRGAALLAALALVLLAVTACGAALPEGHSGSVALVPFFNEDLGIQGVVPLACGRSETGSYDCPGLTSDESVAAIVQQSYPGALEELLPLLLAQTDLIALPRSTGTYKGRVFTWDLYSFATQLADVGPGVFRVDLALAEENGASYFVALVTLPMDYREHAALYDTIYQHALYALEPME